MSDRELFKILKQYKLFAKFYLACATAYGTNLYKNPRERLRLYLDRTAKPMMETKKVEFLTNIRKTWNSNKSIKLI